LIRSGSNAAWGDFAAFVTWDPVLGVLENQGKVRPIARTMMPFYVSIRAGASSDYKNLVEKYTCALRQAWLTYAGDPTHYDKLYSQDASISVEPTVFLKIDELETNMKAKQLRDVDISISQELLEDLNLTASVMKEKKRLSPTFEVDSAIYRVEPDAAHKCP
jgi:ABC-type nitrate/sulfonate/bicarbonate transport system substrate-binding protein